MITLSSETIAAAKDNDGHAITAVIKAFEERVGQLARKYGKSNPEIIEDLEQQGRIAVWEGIRRYEGSTDVAQLFTFMDRTLKGVMSDARKTETRQGVSRQAAADFERALSLAGGDVYVAEFLATTEEAMGARKMSEEAAYAARLSYQGVEWLDAPIGGGDGDTLTLGDTLAETVGVPVDLLEPSDLAKAKRNAQRDRVHNTLNRMGNQHRTVLMALTGIEPVGYYGTEHDDELSADYGIPRAAIKVKRNQAKARFATLWETTPALAL